MKHHRYRRGALAFVLAVGLSACAAAIALAPVVLSFAANLLNTSKKNHGEDYSVQLQTLLEAFVRIREQDRQQGVAYRGVFSLDVAMAKLPGGSPPAAPMKDGDTLRAGSGDAFQISLRPAQDCYVYVVLFDATGAAQPLLGARGDGQLRGGALRELPGPGQVFALDPNRGVETIYLVAVHERSNEIERVLASLAAPRAATRSAPVDFVTEPAIFPNDYGIDGKKRLKSKVTTRSGEQEVSAEQYFAEAGADLVITRWFRHD